MTAFLRYDSCKYAVTLPPVFTTSPVFIMPSYQFGNFTAEDITGFYYLHKYGFLSIDQFTKISGRSRLVAGRRLNTMETRRWVASFASLPQHHPVTRKPTWRAPKIYFLQEKGYQILLEESGLEENQIGRFKRRKRPQWSPKTHHRLRLVDLFISLEVAMAALDGFVLERVFLDYNVIPRPNGNGNQAETTDTVSLPDGQTEKITPDGAFIIRSERTGARLLFFVEMDMGTETIASRIDPDGSHTLQNRLKKYDLYFQSQRYAEKYRPWGDFRETEAGGLKATLLFVTTSRERAENVRASTAALPLTYADAFLFNDFATVDENFFNERWLTRDLQISEGTGLI